MLIFLVESSEQPPRKRRKFTMPKLVTVRDSDWKSRFNLEQKVTKTNEEVGDGGSSRVYKGYVEGKIVAVKELKLYSPRHASSLIAAYDGIFDLAHCNVVKVLGICPNVGQIILEYCEKLIDGVVVHTLADLLLNFGNHYQKWLNAHSLLNFLLEVKNPAIFDSFFKLTLYHTCTV